MKAKRTVLVSSRENDTHNWLVRMLDYINRDTIRMRVNKYAARIALRLLCVPIWWLNVDRMDPRDITSKDGEDDSLSHQWFRM